MPGLSLNLSLTDLRRERDRLEATVAARTAELQEINERLRVREARFRRLSQEFQTVLDGIPDSLTLIAADRKIIWANRGTLELLRLRENPAGSACRELSCCPENGCGDCPVERSFTGGRTESGRIHGADGRVWGVKTFPLPESDGRVTQVIRWASDITEQIRVQENAMRSARLASLGELAAGVAHEINNPNGLILLNAALLRDVLADAAPLLEEHFRTQGDFPLGAIAYSRMREEIPHVIEETLDAAQRIRRIVEDLKNFARQDASQGERVDLNAAAEAALRLVRPVLSKACDRLTLDLADDLPALTGSSQRIEQVVVNLLVNACQALPSRSRGITLSTRFHAKEEEVVLEVRDEGIGIPPEILSQITNPFYTTRRESGGTGLGLAVSARIVKEHGGELLFDSRPGAGTSVRLILPLSKEVLSK